MNCDTTMSENIYRDSPESLSPGSDFGCVNSENKPEPRRGRPKAAMITNLIIEGASSQSGIRCEVCSRVFPRDKSLQAHRRVHTGERPYSCDYPGCLRKFKQSGQLKTHQRLHTGERPFICSVEGCESRFTHANRHCPTHPQAPLLRSEDPTLAHMENSSHSNDVRQWFAKYRMEKEIKTVEKKDTFETPIAQKGQMDLLTPKSEDHDFNSVTNGLVDRELADMTNLTNPVKSPHVIAGDVANLPWSPGKSASRLSPMKTPRIISSDRSRPVKNLFLTEPIANVSPRKRELPKKRWLRIASRELASHSVYSPTISANLNRPTVLRHAGEFFPPRPSSTAGCSPVPQQQQNGADSTTATPYVVTPISQSYHRSLLTPPYSDDKRFYSHDDDEELAIPLPPQDYDISSSWRHSPVV